MKEVPLQPIAAQTLSINLDGTAFVISLYTLPVPTWLLGTYAANSGAVTADSGYVTADSGSITADEGPQESFMPATTVGLALYMDLIAAGVMIFTGKICRSAISMLLGLPYLGVSGDFAWADTQASTNPTAGEDPQYTGLGSRWQLIYLEPAEVAAARAA